jgi:putrescine aminotransferase
VGGSELGCVVAERVLDITTAPGFLETVSALSQRIYDGMLAVQTRHPRALVEVRRCGMFMGLVIGHEDGGLLAMKATFDAGVLTWVAGNDRSVLQFLPPLIVHEALADEIVERMERAFAALEDMIR